MNRRVIKDREINIEVFEPNIYIFEYTSIKKKKNNNNMKKNSIKESYSSIFIIIGKKQKKENTRAMWNIRV